MEGRQRRFLWTASLVVLASCLVLGMTALTSKAATLPKSLRPLIPVPGKWTPIGLAPQPSTPAVWMSAADRASILWYSEIGTTSKFTYEVVNLSLIHI